MSEADTERNGGEIEAETSRKKTREKLQSQFDELMSLFLRQ